MGQISHEMPPKPWSNLWPTGGTEQKKYCLPFQFYKDQAIATAVPTDSALREIQDGEKREVFCALDMLVPGELRHTPKEKFQWSHIFTFSHTQKSTKIINLRCLFLVNSSNLLYAWLHVFPSKKLHIYPGHSLTSSELFFTAIWEAVFQAIVLNKVP